MTRTLVLALCVAFCSTLSFAQDTEFWDHEGPILLQDITVIDGRRDEAVPRRDVLLVDGKIAKVAITSMIADSLIPPGTKVVDGKGLTVLPGLLDMHTHMGGIDYSTAITDPEIHATIPDAEANRLMRYGGGGYEGKVRYIEANLYAGVTTILEVDGSEDISPQLRDEVASGKRIGPTIHIVGNQFSSLESNTRGVMQLTSDEVKKEINDNLDAKVKLDIEIIKLYTGVSPWQARHIMTAAKKRNIRAIADFWCMNNSQEVTQISLIDTSAHGGCVDVSVEEAKWFADNGKFAMFTLSIFDAMRGERGWTDYESRSKFKNPLIVDIWGKDGVQAYYDSFFALREGWHDGERAAYTRQLWGNKLPLLDLNMVNLKRMYDAGVTIMLGTDAPLPPGNWPGEGLHYEMELHVRAGIPPIDVINMATYNGALFLRREDTIGSIEKGKNADLLVVRGNPAENISDTRNIVHVIKDGKIVNRNALKK